MAKVKAELKNLSSVLNEDLNKQMVNKEEVDVIENTRTIRDFGQLLKEMGDEESGTFNRHLCSNKFPKISQSCLGPQNSLAGVHSRLCAREPQKIALKNYFIDKPCTFTQNFYEKSKVITRKEEESSQFIFMDNCVSNNK